MNDLGCLHHCCAPARNATAIFRGDFERRDGEVWVYRHPKSEETAARRFCACLRRR